MFINNKSNDTEKNNLFKKAFKQFINLEQDKRLLQDELSSILKKNQITVKQIELINHGRFKKYKTWIISTGEYNLLFPVDHPEKLKKDKKGIVDSCIHLIN